jgi:hypothetical protein
MGLPFLRCAPIGTGLQIRSVCPLQARVREVLIVVVAPFLDDLAGMAEAAEQMLIAAFVPKLAVGPFYQSVRHRHAECDAEPLDPASSCRASMAFDVRSVPLSLTNIQA